MSLLANEDIENTLLARFDMYDKASNSTDREEYLADRFARILTYLSSGEYFSHIKIRHEDPVNLVHRITAQEFISSAIPKLKEMIRLIVNRQIEEESSFENNIKNPDEKTDNLEASSNKYHDQIDAQIASTYNFLKDRFGEKKNASLIGRHNMKTLSIFAVHAATLLAIKREFPELRRITQNGFTRTLSFRTPNTMPNVKPPNNTFVSYCSEEESFMHKQTEVFEQQGVEPLVKNLLRHLGGNDSDYNWIYDYIDLIARQVSRTYLPFLAKE